MMACFVCEIGHFELTSRLGDEHDGHDDDWIWSWRELEGESNLGRGLWYYEDEKYK